MEFPLTGHRELWEQRGKVDPQAVLVEMWLMQMIRLGRAYFDRQRYSDLFRVLNGCTLVALDPRSKWPPELTLGIEQLAILQWQLGDRLAAWTTLSRAVPIKAKQWVHLAVPLSRSALDREKRLKELKGLKSALKKALEAGKTAKVLGEELRQIRSNERAFERARRRCLAAAPQTAQEYLNRGMARYFQGDLPGVLADFAKAVELYVRALSVDPESQLAHYNLGVAFADAGIYQEAIREWQAVARIDPKSDAARQAQDNIRVLRSVMQRDR